MSDIRLGLTFDDVLLVPQESTVSPADADVRSLAGRGLALEIPILSAAMDTVSGPELVAELAKLGGLGVLHRNCSIAEQVAMVKKVRSLAGPRALIAAAVGPRDTARAAALDQAGVTGLVFDSAHIHKPDLIAIITDLRRNLKAKFIVGNIATAEAARALLTVADAIKVGIGPGSICTTRVVAGVGVPQLTAIMDVAQVAKLKKVPVIADGGLRYSGDVVKALAAGASAVMLGSMLAATDEAPGEKITIAGQPYKTYRGMGSLGVMKSGQSSDRYFQNGTNKYIPEGIEGAVPAKGPLKDVVFQIIGGLKAGMGYIGAQTIAGLQRRAKFIRITSAGRAESHPSVSLLKEAPNYHAQ